MDFSKGYFYKCCADLNSFPEINTFEVVFVGRSNVGKSSIINRLLNRKKIARISSKPGKTATINFYKVDSFFLVDLPGYGFAKVSKTEKQKWNKLIDNYFLQKRLIKLVILIIDCRRGLMPFDLQVINFFVEINLNFVIILNKADKIKKIELENVKDEIFLKLKNFRNFIEIVNFSTKTMQGLSNLKQIILNFVK